MNNRKYTIWGVIGFAMLVLGIALLIIVLLHWDVFGTSVPLISSGWLSNPYRTTRKMKVPMHFRKGHVERNTEKLFRVLIYLMFILPPVIYVVLKTLGNP